MKKLTLVLTLVLVLALALPAFANPFRDVPADHWAYDAVAKLAAEGIISGNPDGTYTGKKNITRYEMAVLVAKAVAASEANADKVAAENVALIQKLATEFSTELNALGLKVEGLEKKVGNVKITGDARARYIDKDDDTAKLDGRVRLTANALVNDQFTAVARLTTGNYDFKNFTNSATPDSTNITFDRLYVNYDGKLADITAGRQGVTVGKATLVDDVTMNAVTVAAPLAGYTLTGTYGKIASDAELTAVQFDGVKLFDKVTLGAGYAKIDETDKSAVTVYGDYALNNRVGFFGEITKSNADSDEMAYYVGAKVKNIVPKADVAVSYAKIEKDALIGNYTVHDVTAGKSVKVEMDYALANNTNLYADFTSSKADGATEKVKTIETGIEFKF